MIYDIKVMRLLRSQVRFKLMVLPWRSSGENYLGGVARPSRSNIRCRPLDLRKKPRLSESEGVFVA